MKHVFFCLCLFFIVTNPEIAAQAVADNYKTKGMMSPDSENVNKESDPKFTALPVSPDVFKKVAQSANQQQVSQLEHGMDIVSDIVKKFIASEYGFSLLSSHKYMVNDCLGLKVSAGQFILRFNNPLIQLTNSGQIKIRLEVDKIKFSALKVRMRPRAPDLSDPNPCHFSGKFEIGGEATDISVTITLSLVTSGLEGSAGFCFFAFDNTYSSKWKIGGINLRPLPNTLDNVGKEMVEDALNTGLDNIFFTKLIQLSKEVIPQYYSACEGVYSTEKVTSSVSGAMTNEETKNKENTGTDAARWTITSNNLKGITGRIISDFPSDTYWELTIRRQSDDDYIKTIYPQEKIKHYVLGEGSYKIFLYNAPLENVPIKKGHDTRLKFGIVNFVSEGRWSIYDATGKKHYKTEYKPMKIVLPVGNYIIKLGGTDYPVVIKHGETEEM